MICSHTSCSREEKVWLPIDSNHKSEAALHPWCIHCGLVKNISDDNPKKIGYWINVLSSLSHRYSFTQCQKRLIYKELQSFDEFIDTYGTTGSSQIELFEKIVRKHCNINRNNIGTFIC